MVTIAKPFSISVTLDQICDYIPGISTLTNLIVLVAKAILHCLDKKTRRALADYSLCFLPRKDYTRCLKGLIPIIGNGLLLAADFDSYQTDMFMAKQTKHLLEHYKKKLDEDIQHVEAFISTIQGRAEVCQPIWDFFKGQSQPFNRVAHHIPYLREMDSSSEDIIIHLYLGQSTSITKEEIDILRRVKKLVDLKISICQLAIQSCENEATASSYLEMSQKLQEGSKLLWNRGWQSKNFTTVCQQLDAILSCLHERE